MRARLFTPPKHSQPQAGLDDLICKSISCVQDVASTKYLVPASKHVGVSEGAGGALAVRIILCRNIVGNSWEGFEMES